MELTTRQAAERLGVTPARIRELVKEKRIKPSRYLNKRMMLIDESELSRPTIANRPRQKPKPTRKGKGAK